MDTGILLFLIKLILGGVVAFFAILIMSKTRAASWMFIVCGFLFSYISIMFDLFVTLGIISEPPIYVYGIPLVSLLSIVVPNVFFAIGFIIKLLKK